MIHGHGGNIYALAAELGCDADDIVDMSSNVNPLGPMPSLIRHLESNLDMISRLPEADAGAAVHAFARHYGLDSPQVVAGNGTTELIYALPAALDPHRVLIVAPAYADYADACRLSGVEPAFMVTTADTGFMPDMARLRSRCGDVDTVFVCNPNNPAGYMIPPESLVDLCADHPHTRFIIDESYMPFTGGDASLMADPPANAVLLSSLSKIFAVPGLRVGFAVGHPDLIAGLRAMARPWNVNALAQAAVTFLFDHPTPSVGFVNHSVDFLSRERRRFCSRFQHSRCLTVFPSETSFVLLRLADTLSGERVCEALAKAGILIRNCRNFHGLSDQFIRISLKDADANDRVAQLLDQLHE